MIRARFLAASLLLFTALAAAATPAANDLPVLRQHVTDMTGTLTAAQLAELDAPLASLEKRKGSQLMVLMIATTGERALEDYSLAVAEKNKVGRAKPDDGLLLLIAKDDRKARIEVGYGLEGAVTDALSSRIIREYLAPRFRQGDYFGGIRDATSTIAKLVDGEALPAPMAPAADSGPPPFFLAVMLGLVVGLFAGGTGMRPVTLRRVGAGAVAAGLAWLVFSAGLATAAAAMVAFLLSGAGTGRFGSGRGGFGSFPAGGWGGGSGGWGGGSSGGGGWSGGGGSFGGGGASGGW